MSLELIYTSASNGLDPGSRGFCTVAATAGIPVSMRERLEGLSAYRHLHPAGAGEHLNPTNYSHLLVRCDGATRHVLSRIGDAGLDYSGRSNKVAHHVVLDTKEMPLAGPAWLLSQDGFVRQQWNDTPRWLDVGPSVPAGDDPPRKCTAWEAATGDAGWAGVLADAALKNETVYIVTTSEKRLLPLFVEALALLPPEHRLRVSFSTFFTKLPIGVECVWRGVIAGTPEAVAAARGHEQIVNASVSADRPPDTPGVLAARRGELLQVMTKGEVTSPIRSVSAPVEPSSAKSARAASLRRGPSGGLELESFANGESVPSRRRLVARMATFFVGVVLVFGAFAAGLFALVRWQEERAARQEAFASAEARCRELLRTAEQHLETARETVAANKEDLDLLMRDVRDIEQAAKRLNVRTIRADGDTRAKSLVAAFSNSEMQKELPSFEDKPFFFLHELAERKKAWDGAQAAWSESEALVISTASWIESCERLQTTLSENRPEWSQVLKSITQAIADVERVRTDLDDVHSTIKEPLEQLAQISDDPRVRLEVMDEVEMQVEEFANSTRQLADCAASATRFLALTDEWDGYLAVDAFSRWHSDMSTKSQELAERKAQLEEWNQQYADKFNEAGQLASKSQTAKVFDVGPQEGSISHFGQVLRLGKGRPSAIGGPRSPKDLLLLPFIDGEVELSLLDGNTRSRTSALGSAGRIALVVATLPEKYIDKAWDVSANGKRIGTFCLSRQKRDSVANLVLQFSWEDSVTDSDVSEFVSRLIQVNARFNEEVAGRRDHRRVFALREPLQLSAFSFSRFREEGDGSKTQFVLDAVRVPSSYKVHVVIDGDARRLNTLGWKPRELDVERVGFDAEVAESLSCHLRFERHNDRLQPMVFFSYDRGGASGADDDRWSWKNNEQLVTRSQECITTIRTLEPQVAQHENDLEKIAKGGGVGRSREEILKEYVPMKRDLESARTVLGRIRKQSPGFENATQGFARCVDNERLSFTIYQYVSDIEDKVPVAVYREQPE